MVKVQYISYLQVFLEKQLNPESAGVVTDSSGNHAQAVAFAASKCVRMDVVGL